jgi:hypothetical protein
MIASCGLLEFLFVACLTCVVAGHTLGIRAWRHRLPQYSRWRWLSDPTYAFRASYYQDPKPAVRLLAASLLTLGGVLVALLAALIIGAQRAGAEVLCGFHF